MTKPAIDAMIHPPHAAESVLALRLRTLCALAVSAAIFWYVGYWVAEPSDPFAPITLLLVRNPLVAFGELIGLTVVAAGLAAVINGRGSRGVGPLAVAVGLMFLSLRGGTADVLRWLLPAGAEGWPVTLLSFELWLWLGLVSLGAVSGRWVESWFVADGAAQRAAAHGVDSAVEIRRAAGAVLVTATAATLLLKMFGGRASDPVLKGQVLFSCGISFFIAATAGATFFRIKSVMWLLLAVAVAGTFAYLSGAPAIAAMLARDGGYLLLPVATRPMPIDYAALGTIGVYLGHVCGRSIFDSSQRDIGVATTKA